MSTPSKLAALPVAALLLAAGTARGESLALMHARSIYSDAKEAPLRTPEGVACSDKGTLAVADTGNQRLVRFRAQDGVVSGGDEIRLAQIKSPSTLALDGKGGLLVLDRKSRRIARVDAAGAFAGFVELKGGGLSEPVSVVSFALDSADHLYVLDSASNKLLVADENGAILRQLPLPAGMFTDLCVDTKGTVYALDAVGAAVWSADKAVEKLSPLSKALRDAVSFPTRIATDGRGRLLVVDQNGMGLVVLGLDGAYLGRQLTIGWSDGLVYYPAQICINAGGDVFVADRGNDRVQYFTSVR